MTLRQRLEAEIERLIDLLDAVDDDPDMEPDADGEPSLGSLCIGGENDLEWDNADLEPSLGWLERENQSTPHHGHYGYDIDFEGTSPEARAA